MTPELMRERSDLVKWLNTSGENRLSSLKSAQKGLVQLQEFLSAKNGDQPKYFTNDGRSEDWFGSYASLLNRETVMMLTYSAYAAELEDMGGTDVWGMFPVPLCDNDTVVSNGGGMSKFIYKNSDNIEQCKALLSFLAEEGNLNDYYAARNDLVTAAFEGVTTIQPTAATIEAMESGRNPPVMLMKDMLYWDPDLYVYFQGMADGTVTPAQLLGYMDAYRASMFESEDGKR